MNAVLIFLAVARPGRRPSSTRLASSLAISILLIGLAIVLGRTFFAERLDELASGRDASFFYRFTGPILVAFDMFRHHPWPGAGLIAESFIADQVTDVSMNSPSFQPARRISRLAAVR